MRVWIGIGSNQDAAINLQRGIDLLREAVTVCAISKVYESAAAGFLAANYLNAVAEIETALSLPDLKAVLVRIEDQCGRKRRDRWGRKSKRVALDFDILLAEGVLRYEYGAKLYALPHPDIRKYAHTAVPLADLLPDWIDSDSGRSLQDLIKGMDVSGLVVRQS
jgi:2-amino-4-hydroxy-6-hydroxymethyldihydropteridine diphosphokinase